MFFHLKLASTTRIAVAVFLFVVVVFFAVCSLLKLHPIYREGGCSSIMGVPGKKTGGGGVLKTPCPRNTLGVARP